MAQTTNLLSNISCKKRHSFGDVKKFRNIHNQVDKRKTGTHKMTLRTDKFDKKIEIKRKTKA